jgi:hypothetical protein
MEAGAVVFSGGVAMSDQIIFASAKDALKALRLSVCRLETLRKLMDADYKPGEVLPTEMAPFIQAEAERLKAVFETLTEGVDHVF